MIQLERIILELERRISQYYKEDNSDPRIIECQDILSFVKAGKDKSVWHSIDEVPRYNIDGTTDFIIDSCYGHIEGEAHSYTPTQWSAHIGFQKNREFRWAYEKDLINFD